MRYLLAALLTTLISTPAAPDNIVIAFPVVTDQVEGVNQEHVIGFLAIETGGEQSRIVASDSALDALQTLRLTVDLLALENPVYIDLNIDIERYAAEENASVRHYLVSLPDRIPGGHEYPGGGGGWWSPRVIWPPQGALANLDTESAPMPWPGGGGGWWPPRAAMTADISDNDLLRGIFSNIQRLPNADYGAGTPIITME